MLKDIQLTTHFKLSDLEDHPDDSRASKNNITPTACIPNLHRLCEQVLEPVLAHFGGEMVIQSGYRSNDLSESYCFVNDSQHTRGQAVDFTIQTYTPNYGIWQWMKDHLPYDELIYNHAPMIRQLWIHVSLKSAGNRHQAYTQVVKPYYYKRYQVSTVRFKQNH